jgi:hypothetical protein
LPYDFRQADEVWRDRHSGLPQESPGQMEGRAKLVSMLSLEGGPDRLPGSLNRSEIHAELSLTLLMVSDASEVVEIDSGSDQG